MTRLVFAFSGDTMEQTGRWFLSQGKRQSVGASSPPSAAWSTPGAKPHIAAIVGRSRFGVDDL